MSTPLVDVSSPSKRTQELRTSTGVAVDVDLPKEVNEVQGRISNADFITLFDWWSSIDTSITAELKSALFSALDIRDDKDMMCYSDFMDAYNEASSHSGGDAVQNLRLAPILSTGEAFDFFREVDKNSALDQMRISKADFITLFDWWSSIDTSITAELKSAIFSALDIRDDKDMMCYSDFMDAYKVASSHSGGDAVQNLRLGPILSTGDAFEAFRAIVNTNSYGETSTQGEGSRSSSIGRSSSFDINRTPSDRVFQTEMSAALSMDGPPQVSQAHTGSIHEVGQQAAEYVQEVVEAGDSFHRSPSGDGPTPLSRELSSSLLPSHQWSEELSTGLATRLLEDSIINLKAEGLVRSQATSEATSNETSEAPSPVSRPQSGRLGLGLGPTSARPSSARPSRPSSRPISAHARSRPDSRGSARTRPVTPQLQAVSDLLVEEHEHEHAVDVTSHAVDSSQDPTLEEGVNGDGNVDMDEEEADTGEEVQVEVVLDMTMQDIMAIGAQEELKEGLCDEMCNAYSLNANVNKMCTLKLQNTERSLVARIVLQPGLSAVGDTPVDIVKKLIAQTKDRDSTLRSGKYASRILSLRLISKDELQKEHEAELAAAVKVPELKRNISVEVRAKQIRQASERFLALSEANEGIDVLDLQDEEEEDEGATSSLSQVARFELLEVRSEPQTRPQTEAPAHPPGYELLEVRSEPQTRPQTVDEEWKQTETWLQGPQNIMRTGSPSHISSTGDLGEGKTWLTAEVAAIRLQRCMRGMIDRIFFRKYQKLKELRKKEQNDQQTRRRQREAQIAVARKAEIEARASIPNMQVDGYMSRASMNRIQERGGEPLERSEVVRKGKKILGTKKWAGIEVTSPDHESIYYRGKVSQIKWKATGNIPIERVGLYLYLNGEPIHTIVKSVPNVGKYIFTLPEIFQQAEEAYQILVIAEDSKQPDCHGFSAPFTVAERPIGELTKVPPSIPTLTITFPVRDGWSWPTGSSYVLSWKSSGVVQNVQIDCLRHGVFAFRIASGLLNCGAFPFTMPMDAPTGEGFQIRVRSVALKKACGMSASFSIIERMVAQAVPRRAPAQVVRKIVNVHDQNPRLLAPLHPPPPLRQTWSTSNDDTPPQARAHLDGRDGSWSPSRARGKLHEPPVLSPLSPLDASNTNTNGSHLPSPGRSAVLQGGGTGRSIGKGSVGGHVLVPNGNLAAPAISLPNQVGHLAINHDSPQQPSKFTDGELADNVIAIETIGDAGKDNYETVYNRLRSKYSNKERETGVWIKPEIERFAGKLEEVVKPRTGTEYMMASALTSSPHIDISGIVKLNDVNLPGVYSRKSNSKSRKSRRGARSADVGLSSSKICRTSCDSMHVKTSFMDKRESRADREKIISGAEEFLQMRDKIFARQLEVLEQEGKMRTSVLESQKDFNSTGRYTAVMLPPVDRPETHAANATTFSSTSIKTSTHRPHTFGTMSDNLQGKDEYRRYDSSRHREGLANQAIADYYDSVQNRLYGVTPIF